MNTIHVNPQPFAYLVAIGETPLAIGLIFSVPSNLTNIVGIVLASVIWPTAKGFGGPCEAGSADIGSAIIYVLVFVGLFLSSVGLYLGFDKYPPSVGALGISGIGFFTESPLEAQTKNRAARSKSRKPCKPLGTFSPESI